MIWKTISMYRVYNVMAFETDPCRRVKTPNRTLIFPNVSRDNRNFERMEMLVALKSGQTMIYPRDSGLPRG